MAGIFTYIGVMTLVGVWTVGWLGIALLAGAVFDLPPKTCALLGALLGPLGVIASVFTGFATRKDDIAASGKELFGRAATRTKITKEELMRRRRTEDDPFS